MPGVFLRRERCEDTENTREETGVTQLQDRDAEDGWSHQKLRGQEDFSPRACREAQACQHFNFRLWPPEECENKFLWF